jgi:hypothetical protein
LWKKPIVVRLLSVGQQLRINGGCGDDAAISPFVEEFKGTDGDLRTDDLALSEQAKIKIYDIKRILAGEIHSMSFRRIYKFSKVFNMPVNLFIDFISL